VTVWAPRCRGGARGQGEQGTFHLCAPLCCGSGQKTPGPTRRSQAASWFSPHWAAGVLASGQQTEERHGKWQRTNYYIVAAARPARSWPIACRPGAPTGPAVRGGPGQRRGQGAAESPTAYSGTPTAPFLTLVHAAVSSNIRRRTASPCAKYEQARVLGGGSYDQRPDGQSGAPTDYNEWASRGAEGWAGPGAAVLKRSATSTIDGPYHGKDGAFPCAESARSTGPGSAKA